MKKQDCSFETKAVHVGYESNHFGGSLTPPLFQTSTFTFTSAEQGERRFSGEEAGYVYTRLGNPTTSVLEERIAALEGGEKALAFASGMAAVSACLIALTKANDHILVSQGVYGCTFGLLEMMEEKYNITHSFSAMDTKEEIERHIRSNTKVIYVETPINPTMQLIDLALVVEVARQHDILVVVDNTFCSPYLQRPLELGCDVVLHSATKYIGGHGDVIAGLLVGKEALMSEIARTTQKDIGGVLSPFDAWLLLRGLKTLHVRMDRHCDNAAFLAEKLAAHELIEHVYYPGYMSEQQNAIAAKQMKKNGGVLSFTIKGTKQQAQQLLNKLELVKVAVSLGDIETLIQHPATMTHSVIPVAEREKMGISDQLIRLSVGLESPADIWADLEQALAVVAQLQSSK